MENVALIDPPQGLVPLESKLNVLILDDNDFDRQRLKRLIEDTEDNVEVFTCSDLQEFEQKLAGTPLDICLVDHHLGDFSGVDAVAAVKRHVGLNDVPVIMISGREDTDTVVESIKAGCWDYLSKQTLTAQRLHKTILEAISSSLSDPVLTSAVRDATNNVMGGIAKECISELKPRLGRMYRQIAFIRSCHTRGLLPSPEALDDVEEECLTIWRFFDEVDTYTKGLLKTRH